MMPPSELTFPVIAAPVVGFISVPFNLPYKELNRAISSKCFASNRMANKSLASCTPSLSKPVVFVTCMSPFLPTFCVSTAYVTSIAASSTDFSRLTLPFVIRSTALVLMSSLNSC